MLDLFARSLDCMLYFLVVPWWLWRSGSPVCRQAGHQLWSMFYVYIIRSVRDGKFYTGMTDDMDRRITEHTNGKKSTPSTYGRGPFELIHVEVVSTRLEARELEKYFKSGVGREIRNEIVDNMVAMAQW
jgi:putative endonuclease